MGDRRQETGDRRQETEDRRQKTGDRRQETEDSPARDAAQHQTSPSHARDTYHREMARIPPSMPEPHFVIAFSADINI
jgi:hypothetical protein